MLFDFSILKTFSHPQIHTKNDQIRNNLLLVMPSNLLSSAEAIAEIKHWTVIKKITINSANSIHFQPICTPGTSETQPSESKSMHASVVKAQHGLPSPCVRRPERKPPFSDSSLNREIIKDSISKSTTTLANGLLLFLKEGLCRRTTKC